MQQHLSTPPCLNWPADDRARVAQAKLLPRVLFGQLKTALEPLATGDVDECPNPALLFELWDERPALAIERSEVSPAMLVDWLDAYCFAWQQEMISMEHPGSAREYERRVPPSPYVQACAALLHPRFSPSRITIPIAVVNGKSSGRVQWLHMDVCPHRGGECLIHPGAEFTRQYFEQDFIESIERAWRLAVIADGELAMLGKRDAWSVQSEALHKTTVFWHITETDGRQVIDDYRQGTSASAAAFRAFWHIRRGLSLDPEVYVLGSCAAGDGSIQDVGGMAQKITAVCEHRQASGIHSPAALVVSSNGGGRTPHDTTAIAQAGAWAAVHQVSTCAELAAVRSCESMAAISYLRHLSDSLDQCRLLPMGKRLSEVHVPTQVWKDERIRPEHETGWRDERESDAPSGPEERDSPPKKRRVRQPWELVFQMHRGRSPLVLVGGPGSGKSTVLHWTAREMAMKSAASIESRADSASSVHWPVLVNLDTWAAHEPRQQPRASLISLITSTVPEDMPPLEREAVTLLIKNRLSTATDHTCLFFDSLDQVATTRGDTLRRRLAALSDLTSRLVLTTRESGLRTHDEAMKTLPTPTTVQSAPLTPEDACTLAAKWLGAEHAARLERHLRSHPSLGIVADSPLLLTLACLVASETPGLALPETPAALYQEMTLLLAQGRWRNGDDAPPASHDPHSLLDQLPAIAWRLFVRSPGVNRFDRDTMLEAIRQGTNLKGKAATDFLDLQLVELGFVEASQESKTEPQYVFRHTTLLEFLAARHLATTVHLHTWVAASVDTWQDGTGWHTAQVGDLLDAQAFEPSWEPVMLFVAGLLKEPLPLIEMLADRRKDDLFRHRLHLLCKCYGSLSAGVLKAIHPRMQVVLTEIMTIAERSTREPGGNFVSSRLALWWEWLQPVLKSPFAVDEIIDRLLALKGNFSTKGWSTGAEWKVIELLKNHLVPLRVHESAVDKIAATFDRDVRRWGHDAAGLALRLASPSQKDRLIDEFLMWFRATENYRCKIGAAAGLVEAGNKEVVHEVVQFLLGLVRKHGLHRQIAEKNEVDSCDHDDLRIAVRTLARQLSGSFGDLIAHTLLPVVQWWNSNLRHTVAWEILDVADGAAPSLWIDRSLEVLVNEEFKESTDYNRWAAELLAKRDDWYHREMGVNALLKIASNKQSHGWAYAASWLVQHGNEESADKARDILFSEARNIESGRHKEAVAELLDMRAIAPTGEPILKEIHEAVVAELQYHGERYGPRLHIELPGVDPKEVDMLLLEENPAAVIRVLHTFNGPKMDRRKGRRDEDMEGNRHWKGRLLIGTRFWPEIVGGAVARLKSGADNEDGDLGLAVFGALSSELLPILQREYIQTKGSGRGWRLRELVWELNQRGWRLRLHGRKIEVLRRGQEEPRADADFGC